MAQNANARQAPPKTCNVILDISCILVLLFKIRNQNGFTFILNFFGGIFALYAGQTMASRQEETVCGRLGVK